MRGWSKTKSDRPGKTRGRSSTWRMIKSWSEARLRKLKRCFHLKRLSWRILKKKWNIVHLKSRVFRWDLTRRKLSLRAIRNNSMKHLYNSKKFKNCLQMPTKQSSIRKSCYKIKKVTLPSCKRLSTSSKISLTYQRMAMLSNKLYCLLNLILRWF